jgi:hypothetical protein
LPFDKTLHSHESVKDPCLADFFKLPLAVHQESTTLIDGTQAIDSTRRVMLSEQHSQQDFDLLRR